VLRLQQGWLHARAEEPGWGLCSSREHGAGRDADGETVLGPTEGWFALQKGSLQFRCPPWGSLCFPSLAWVQEILRRRLVPGQEGSTRRDVRPLLFPGTSEGDKKTEKSPTDDKVAIILAMYPKGP